ncbi:MAG: asparagine synthase (glutamine-hydrolyzing) [Planctomycetota bacterium]
MCGIAGILNNGGEPGEGALAGMVERLRHRGPDDTGAATSGRCSLGHTRLSVIDLETGHQPLASEDAAILLVCNGEIYNFRELRAELESRGHQFKTRSDNEVIVHLYEEHGAACVEHLDGMFAFALWDAKSERLVLARDRMGEKPLMYYDGGGFFAFASELRALLAIEAVPRVLDTKALHHYLSYLAVPCPLTIYHGVRKLPPAHVLIAENGESRLERYWNLPVEPEDCRLDDAAAQVRAAVEGAVRSRLVADVPLGAFLSGGIDSSIVVALMSKHCGDRVRTFSIGFGDPDYDELEYARIVAEQFDTSHTEFQVTPDAVDVLPLLARRYGEPFADPSAIPTYYLAQKTAEHVKVALTGDGADEAFGGYPRHIAARACGQVDHVTPSLGKLIGLLGSVLPKGKDRKSSLRRARLLLGAMHLSPAKRHAAWLAYASEAEKQHVYTPTFAEAAMQFDASDAFTDAYASCADLHDPAAAAMFADLAVYLPNDPLVKMDIATMANGLEARAPLLDYRVVEAAFRIPSRHKLYGGRGKFVLRYAFRDLLPRPIYSRGKMGFGVPIARWLREDLAPFAEETLLRSDTILNRVFSITSIEQLLAEHKSGKADRAYTIWTLLCFELWAREFDPQLPF